MRQCILNFHRFLRVLELLENEWNQSHKRKQKLFTIFTHGEVSEDGEIQIKSSSFGFSEPEDHE